MRVGINAQLLGHGPGYRQTGISRYVERLLAALPGALSPDDEVLLLRSGDAVAARPVRRAAWEQVVLPVLTARRRLDLLHAPVNVVPLLTPCPTVVTIHDLAYLRRPDVVPARRRRYFGMLTRWSVRRASRVLAVSESTRRDVVELLGVPPERVITTPLAADDRFRPPPPDEPPRLRSSDGLDRPFVLYVGTVEPRKNLPALLRAFDRIAPEVPHDLVVLGPDGWMTDAFYATLRALRHRDRVRRFDFVPAEELPAWYGAAAVFAFPSLYEGFGLPVLEAMACGAPVVTANVSSLPEVVGDAALTVAPEDEAALAEAILGVLTDPALAASLRARGLDRAKTFSWQRTADLTVTAYHEAAGTIG